MLGFVVKEWMSGRENLPSSRSSHQPFWLVYCIISVVS